MHFNKFSAQVGHVELNFNSLKKHASDVITGQINFNVASVLSNMCMTFQRRKDGKEKG